MPEPTPENVEWLLDLARRAEPPAVRFDVLVRKGFTSTDPTELARLRGAGLHFEIDGSFLWVNADEFLAVCLRIAAEDGPPMPAPTLVH